MPGRNARVCTQSGWAIDPVPLLADNYAWVVSNDGHAIVVDPGDASPVTDWLCARSLRLSTILLTHHHPDHIGGVPGLRGRWPDAAVVGPHDHRIDLVTHRVAHGERFTPFAGAPAFEVIGIPGHTSTHLAYHGDGLLFCGDTLFSAGCGRMFEGTAAQMLASLDTLAALPAATLVCCGHEYTQDNCAFAVAADPDNAALAVYRQQVMSLRVRGEPSLPSRLGDEREVNPFLRIDTAGVRDTLVRRQSMPPDADRVAAFAALRSWKDHYRG